MKNRTITAIFGAVFAAIFVTAGALPATAQDALSTPARAAVLIELETDTTLLAKNPHTPLPPASLSKLATIYAAFKALDSEGYSLDDTFLVSEKAWRTGGSKMFVEVGKQVRIEDLLRGVIVSSGNDASIVIAEGLDGDEDAFAARLNTTAAELGLQNSEFRNATGLPDPRHRMSAYDVALLSERLVEDFPQYYGYFAEPEFRWSNIRQSNRNPLLGLNDITVDGLKTGHTNAAGYGLAASAINEDGRRLVLAILGLDSTGQRRQEAERILKWGFRNFATHTLLDADEVLGDAPVWLGRDAYVSLKVEEPVRLTLSHADLEGMSATIRYVGPVSAPVVGGQRIGVLELRFPSGITLERDLLAVNSVEPLSGASRINAALRYLVFGPESVLDAAQQGQQ